MRAALFLLMMSTAQMVLGADYEIMDKQHSIVVESGAFATEHHKIVVRILTVKGTDYKEFVAVNGYVQVRNVRGSVRYPDGRVTPIQAASIFEVPVTESGDMLTDFKAVAIVPPELETGCIVTVEYDRNITNLLYISPWVFASSVPIRKTAYTISFPAHMPIKFHATDNSIRVRKSETAGKITLAMEAFNQNEIQVRGSSAEMNQRVIFVPQECMTERWKLSTRSWSHIAQWFSELAKFAYQSESAMDAIVQDVRSKHTDPAAIAEALYQYIQNHFVYTAIEIGIGGYKPRFANHTFQKKFGDCKDLTVLFVTLLQKAGIEAYPALVDTRSSRFFYSDFPSPNQFNHCIAFLPRIRNGVWVDSTVKNFRLGEIPAVLHGKQALVAGGPNVLVKIPENFQESNLVKLTLAGQFSNQKINWKGTVETAGEAAGYVSSFKNALLKTRIKNYVYANLLAPALPLMNVITDYQDERSFSLHFAVPVRSLGNYRTFVVNAVNYAPLENLPLDPASSEYFSLGSPVRFVLQAELALNGHQLVSAPLSKNVKGEYVSYTLKLNEEAGKLHYVADTYFANGLLDRNEMKLYLTELGDLAALIHRTLVVK